LVLFHFDVYDPVHSFPGFIERIQRSTGADDEQEDKQAETCSKASRYFHVFSRYIGRSGVG
jgi:hypothetical protein